MSKLQYLISCLLCVLVGEGVCGQQLINNGGTITMSGAVFMTVNNASFINNGTFTPSTSTVAFTGSGTATPYNIGTTPTTGTSNTNFYNLTVSNTNTGTVNANVTVANILSVNAGTLACGTTTPATNLTLLSTSSNTANVGAVGGAITGFVNVQRYIPAKRAWRLLTAPISGTSTIFGTWQNSGASTANIGMFVTGPAATNATPSTSNTGLDYSSRNNSSMKSWNYAATIPAFASVSTTNTGISNNTGSADNIGYFVFVRGDRSNTSLLNTGGGLINTTLNCIGTLQTGNQVFSASSVAGNYTLIGNPYAAAVDFKNIANSTTGGLSNIAYSFYTWDAKLATVGGYVTFTSTDGTNYSNAISTTQSTVLQSGQAFFVKTTANSSASVTFKEIYKSGTVSAVAGFKPMEPATGLNIDESLRANLYYLNGDSSLILADGVLTQFNSQYHDSILINEDAAKLTNVNENLGLSRHGATLAIESRPNLTITDTLFLNLTRTTQRAYRFQFEPTNLDNTNLIGYLQDKYLNTSAEISLSKTTPINFTVDGNAASAAADRFQIVFKTFLPFAFTDIAGNKKNRDIAIDWKVSNETDIVQYDIEKSADGLTFTKMCTQVVTGSNNPINNYTWLDTKAIIGDNIYRVKMVSLDGTTKYTSVVLVNMAPLTTGNFIYPNPVKNKQVNLQMNNQPIGSYKLVITNNSGQIIYTSTIQNNGNNSRFVITLNNEVAAGVYNLQITNGTNKLSTQKLIVE